MYRQTLPPQVKGVARQTKTDDDEPPAAIELGTVADDEEPDGTWATTGLGREK